MPEYDIKIVCPECDTNAPKDTREKAESQVKSHNNSIHGGEEVAYVEGKHDPLLDFLDYIDDVNREGHIYYAYRNEGMIRGVCPECDRVEVETELDTLIEKVEKHNALKHDGTPIGGIVTEDLNGIAAERKRPMLGEDTPSAAEILAECDHEDEITSPGDAPNVA